MRADDKRIFDALCAGASGYLSKKTQPVRLLESLQEAVSGGANVLRSRSLLMQPDAFYPHPWKADIDKRGVGVDRSLSYPAPPPLTDNCGTTKALRTANQLDKIIAKLTVIF